MFTGGEPLLHASELLDDISFAYSLCYESSVGTNGFWGNTREKADTVQAALAQRGVRRIALSTGRFHLSFVPFRNVLNILDAAHAVEGMGVQVKLTGVLPDDRLPAALRKRYPQVRTRIVPLIPTGRGAELPDSFFSPRVTINAHGRCADVCRPFVGYDGTIWRCCNINER
jgi:MoaA/NifB/PqqE/SkfB family radical SAM enzyme